MSARQAGRWLLVAGGVAIAATVVASIAVIGTTCGTFQLPGVKVIVGMVVVACTPAKVTVTGAAGCEVSTAVIVSPAPSSVTAATRSSRRAAENWTPRSTPRTTTSSTPTVARGRSISSRHPR